MKKCKKCGKKGLFLDLDFDGLCKRCHDELREHRRIERRLLEEIAKNGVGIDVTVAGVTFKTGRKSRQTILREIYFKDPPFEKKPEVTLEKYKFEDEDAVGVYANGIQVGNIAKKDLPWVFKYWEHNLVVEKFKVYGGGDRNWGMELSLKADPLNKPKPAP